MSLFHLGSLFQDVENIFVVHFKSGASFGTKANKAELLSQIHIT